MMKEGKDAADAISCSISILEVMIKVVGVKCSLEEISTKHLVPITVSGCNQYQYYVILLITIP